jgi:hypothetical protein
MKKWWWMFQSVVYEGVNYSLPIKAWISTKLGLIFNILYTRKDIQFLQKAQGERRRNSHLRREWAQGTASEMLLCIAVCVFGVQVL